MTNLQEIQDLYDRNLFLQAFRRSKDRWHPSIRMESLSLDELVLGGRLAARLGGLRLSRRLFMAAFAKDPANPLVRYFTLGMYRRGHHLFDALRAFEAQPDLGADDPSLEGAWFASHAQLWAELNDAARAEACLKRAHLLAPHDGWILSCESNVFGLLHRREEALKAAEQAWEISPGAPFAAICLGSCLTQLGRVEESAQRLAKVAEEGESYEVALSACWHLCALVETLEGEERSRVLDRALALAETLQALAPLADRETRSQFAHARLDMAALADDRDGIRRWAEQIRSPFYRQFVANLRQHPQGRRIRLPYRRVLQGRHTCLPASISSVLAALGIHIETDTIASDITYGGTRIWEAAEWLEKRGLATRFFIVHPETATALIRNGIPFVLHLELENINHAVAVVGLDEAARTLLIHDPNSFRTIEVFLEGIGDDEAPLGPGGMVIVPADKVALLDQLLPPDQTDAATACHMHSKIVEKNGLAAARGVVDELAVRYPSHPITQYLQAVQLRYEDRTGESMALFQRLLNQYPNSPAIRQNLIFTCRTLGNSALTRRALEGVVERGMLPGVQSAQEWRYPPVTYVSQYADQLRLSAATRDRARLLLRSALRRRPDCAEAWHILGGLLWDNRDNDGALLAFRIASCIENNNEQHARSYCQALHFAGREVEGLASLEERARRFSANPNATGPWISWIGTLEEYGHPAQALAICEEALQARGDSAELLAFVVPFLARMGQWERSETCLRRLEGCGNPVLSCEAAVVFHSMRGDLAGAAKYAEDWLREAPQLMSARSHFLNLVARRRGPRAAVDLAESWSREHPGHDPLEQMYYYQLESIDHCRKQDALLLRRVKRNAEDGWAWRTLAFRRLAEYERADDQRRMSMHTRIEKLLAQCDRTAPEDPATLRTQALWEEVRGHWSDAVCSWMKAIDAEPAEFYSYRRVWDCSARLDEVERHRVLEHLESMLLRCAGRLSIARDLISLIARRFGVAVAKEAAMRWKGQRADDPEVIEASADLLLEYGHGRSDASQALAMLESAVSRFPFHIGLRFSLALACNALGKNAEAEEILREILRRHPDKTDAYIRLAYFQERRGDLQGATCLLRSAAAVDPLNPEIWIADAGLLLRNRQYSEARTIVRERSQQLPENAYWRDNAIRLLMECDDEEGAIAAAREGVRVLPRNGYLWYRLAETLNRLLRFAGPGEVESCLRHALSLDSGLLVAADSLSYHLAEQLRFDEAEALIENILPRISDPSPAQGRLAWLHRERGRKDEALEEMAKVVRVAPWFRWGWECLMYWLAADEKWQLARSLLCPVPPEHRTDVQFRRLRLQVLDAAGTPAAELDAEWNELLAEFPDDVDFHLKRYDDLRYHNRFRESATVLNAILSLDPRSPEVLARLVEIRAQEGKQDEAMDALLRLWFAEREESSSPADRAWEAARTGRFDVTVYFKARQRLTDGLRPTLSAFAIIAKCAGRREGMKSRSRRPLWRTLQPGPGARELMRLMGLVDRTPWADGRFRAIVFRQLSALGYQRLVVRYWKKHPVEAEADAGSWSAVGVAMHDLNRKRAARKFLASWREHPGVEMWVIYYYLQCFARFKKADRREVLAVCRDALAGLHHDHTAKYLAHLQAEMCALLDDSDAFRETWEKYRNYFTGELEKLERFENKHRYLLSLIPRMGGFLDQNNLDAFRHGCRQMRKGLAPHPLPAAAIPGRAKTPWWVWILIFVSLANILGQLLKR